MRTRNRKSSKDLIEISLVSDLKHAGASEIFRNIFLRHGFPWKSIVESRDGLTSKASIYVTSKEKGKLLKNNLLNLRMNNVMVRLKLLKEQDWKEKWKVEFHPFALTPKIDVVPYWERNTYKKNGRSPLFIKSINAFGTGMHDTTRFMAKCIAQCQGLYQSFLDIGTGTGILSMVALKSGATSADAVDIDRAAIAAARVNMRVNRLAFRRTIVGDIGNIPLSGKYDFVASNFITHDLINMKRKILRFVKPGGFWAVSGISRDNFDLFMNAYRVLPLRNLKVIKGMDWVAVLMKRK